MNNKKLKIKNFLKEFSKIAGMLLACAALGFFLAIGIRSSSPDRIAKKYFSYYVTNNYEEMYKMIDVKESEFINLENFKIKCEGEKIYGSIKDYKISKPVKQGDTITYVSEDQYLGWNSFKGNVLEFFSILERVFGQSEIQRTSIRFINRFSFPDFDKPEDYINTFISATGESQPYPLRQYGFRLLMDVPNSDTYSIVNHNVERVIDGKFLYTFDIDVLNNQKLLFSIDSIDNNLDSLREIKNNIFFNTLTDKTLSLCN